VVKLPVVGSFVFVGSLPMELLPKPVSLREYLFERGLRAACPLVRVVPPGRLGHRQSSSAIDAERRRNVHTLSAMTPTNTAAGNSSFA
jgi:hypothetical protein